MQSIILEGTKQSTELYIKKFIVTHAIPSFGITSFTEGAKIADVFYMQKILSRKVSHPILFIFQNDITLEAQNALLKTLEELPENVYVFFCVPQASLLLPTICSRSKIMPLTYHTSSESNIDSIHNMLYQKSPFDRLMIWEVLEEKYENGITCDILLIALHRRLISDKHNRIHTYRILKHLLSSYFYINKNNVSLKMALDIALLSA